jgi:amino acid transporter
MKLLFYVSIGAVALGAATVKTALAQTFYGVQFDPEGKIKQATKLTDESPERITVNAIQWVLGFLGLIAVIMILWGGITWMTSAGNEEKVRKAKEVLRAAIIGMIVVLLSWAIVTFVVGRTNEFTQ